MAVRSRSHRPRGGRLLLGAAAVLAVSGAAVLGLDMFGGSGPPPRPGRDAARPGTTPSVSVAALPAARPVRVDIPRIGVHASLLSVGLEKDGTVQTPPLAKAGLVGWYDKGPAPGQLGPAVLLGHVDTKKGPAVFFELGRLKPGSAVDVTRADGVVATFRVDSVERVPKARFPTQRVYGDLPYAGLRLITCGGAFDGHHYLDNTIVYGHMTGHHGH